VHGAFVRVVAVPPDHELLEQKEGEDPREQRAERGGRGQFLQRFGQQRQQRDAEQRADGIADGPGRTLIRRPSPRSRNDDAATTPPKLPSTLSPTAAA
jgi:hypothetical protein